MVFKVYAFDLSTFAQQVIMTLIEKDYDYKIIPVRFLRKEQYKEDYTIKHPFGKIPVIEDESGHCVFESVPICRYLERLDPKRGIQLIPSDIESETLVEEWVSCGMSYLNPYVQVMIVERAIKIVKGIATDPLALERAVKFLGKALDIYEKHLTDHDFLVGDRFTLADLVHIPHLNAILDNEGYLIKDRPHVDEWFHRISNRPSWHIVSEKFIRNKL